MSTKIITIVNSVEILELENNLVPIKPICEALGIDSEPQRAKIKSSEDLNSVATLSVATGADGKQYEMLCLPLKYIFGWLFTINPKNVKPEAQEAVRNYRKECYDSIYDSLFLHKIFLQEKDIQVEEKLMIISNLKTDFSDAKRKLNEAETELKEIRTFSFDDWKLKKSQLELFENSTE